MAISEIITAIDQFFNWICTDTFFLTPGWCWFFLIGLTLIIGGMFILCILSKLLGIDDVEAQPSYASVEEIPPAYLNAMMLQEHPPGTKNGWRDPNNPDHWNLEDYR